MNVNRCAVLIAAFLGVGCAAVTATYPVVGRFDDYNEVFYGQVDANLLVGISIIEVQTQNSSLACSGTARPTSQGGPCAGRDGVAQFTCSDGRTVRAVFRLTSCTTGFGEGQDSNGAGMRFAFGMTEAEAQRYLSSMAIAVDALPDLPVYRPGEVRRERGFATGTGFLVSDDGLIVTNYHVIEDASVIEVVTQGSAQIATVVAMDSTNDIALLRAPISGRALPVRSARSSLRGEEVMTLGYPLIQIQGQSQRATFRRINALSGIEDDARFVQIDVPVQPGNSGGPLLNKRGEVIGVVTATLDQLVTLRESGSLPQNVNYAVKADYVLPLLPEEVSVPLDAQELDFPTVVQGAEGSVFLIVTR